MKHLTVIPAKAGIQTFLENSEQVTDTPHPNPLPQGEREWWEKPLSELNHQEWEALCDGCGLCCLNKVEDEETGALTFTTVACDLFDCDSCTCQDYTNRKAKIPDCVSFTLGNLRQIDWLPPTCAYVLRGQDKPLKAWHYLLSGSRQTVHEAGISAMGKVTAFERDVELEDYEQHPLILPEG